VINSLLASWLRGHMSMITSQHIERLGVYINICVRQKCQQLGYNIHT